MTKLMAAAAPAAVCGLTVVVVRGGDADKSGTRLTEQIWGGWVRLSGMLPRVCGSCGSAAGGEFYSKKRLQSDMETR